VDAVEALIEREGPETVAAVVAEPVVGSTAGALVPPGTYWPRLADLCRRHGVLLIADEMILDVGPAAVEALADALKTCRTLVWNGPLGAFETPPFDEATVALAKTAAALTQDGSLVSVAGGGDTVAALNHAGVAGDFTFVSTAGGAFLEWMEGRSLPGVAALQR
jgi:phosphoglycerate kinase